MKLPKPFRAVKAALFTGVARLRIRVAAWRYEHRARRASQSGQVPAPVALAAAAPRRRGARPSILVVSPYPVLPAI